MKTDRQPVDSVVGDPVRQDNDKIWIFQKNPRAHKNKIGTPPPQTKIPPPPKNEEFMDMEGFLQKECIFSRCP